MTLIGWMGFDFLDPSGNWQEPQWGGTVGTSTSSPRTGTRRGSQNSGAGPRFALHNADQDSTLICGWASKEFNLIARDIITFWGDSSNSTIANSGTAHITLRRKSTGAIEAYRGTSGGTLLGTSATTPLLLTDTWQYIEVKVTLSDSVGVIEVRVDETVVLTLTGIDTKNAGTETTFDAVEWYSNTSVGTAWDDMYVCNTAGSTNNNYLGAIHLEPLAPTGNGNSSQWVGSDGNSTDNYVLVQETPTADTANYVESSTTNDKDTYAFANSAFSTSLAVKAVVVHIYAEKTDAGAREIDTVARLSGTENTAHADQTLINGTYQMMSGVHETKPGGGSWSVADVNNAEFGIKAV